MGNGDRNGGITLRAKLGYGTIGLSTMSNGMLSAWQVFFLTTFAGLDVGTVGLIVSGGQIVSALSAPVWGYVSDRMYATALGRRLGRRKATLLLTVPGLFAFYLVQFFPGLPVWGYAAANLLYWATNCGFTTVQYVLPAEMSTWSGERAQLVGIGQISNAVGTLALSVLNTWLFAVWGGDRWETYFRMALMYGLFMVAILAVGMFAIPEHPYDEATEFSDADAAHGDRLSLCRRVALVLWNYLTVFSVREFRAYLGMYLSAVMFRSVRGVTLTYFLVFVLGLSVSEVSLSSGLTIGLGIALVSFFMWLNARIGSTRAYQVGSVEAIAVFLLMFALTRVAGGLSHGMVIVLWIALSLALNFGITGVVNACDFAYSFIPDVDEILTGKRREGQYASVNATVGNLFVAVENVLITGALSAMGFVSGVARQPPIVMGTLTAIFCFLPIAFIVLGLFFSSRVRLNDESRAALSAEIERLRAGGSKADVDPGTKALIERLTGYTYERCWGNNRIMSFTHK